MQNYLLPNSQNSCSNDYCQFTARTGVANISTENTSLTGSGAIVTVISAGGNGTLIKSILVKAVNSTTQGMIRLFVCSIDPEIVTLYKEVPIPAITVTSVEPSFEIHFDEYFKLNPGFTIKASTQKSESFNIIAEGLDWAYPDILPPSCNDFIQETANTGNNKIDTANSNRDGTGAIVDVFTAASNGSTLKTIIIKATENTNQGMIRLYIKVSDVYYLFKEIKVESSIQTGIVPSFEYSLFTNYAVESTLTISASTEVENDFNIVVEALSWEYPSF